MPLRIKPPSAHTTRVFRKSAVIAFLIFGTAYALVPESFTQVSEKHALLAVSVINPITTQVLSVLFGAAGLLLLAAIILSCFQKQKKAGALSLLLCGGLLALVAHVFCNLGPWITYGKVTDAQGREYAFLESSFLMGQTLALGADPVSEWGYTRYRILGETHGDSPRFWAPVIRPAGSPARYGELTCAPNGLILGLRYRHQCYFTYDPATAVFARHEAVQKLSPFILLTPTTTPNPAGITEIDRAIRAKENYTSGTPERDALIEATRSEIPGVAKLAAEWLTTPRYAAPHPAQ